ncbi:uncharacterized protein PAC_15087 [Phialocephala subalpina]|uniref:Zn(2)-C6 fungal-type domain-containing protein n=1 Tax=Phialocephala subalpina TaxID=576137 RepID=A0A1L7XJP9_9HELO|nr:uncharacterized protein PAC_15087 [Phialocephala subalpina]
MQRHHLAFAAKDGRTNFEKREVFIDPFRNSCDGSTRIAPSAEVLSVDSLQVRARSETPGRRRSLAAQQCRHLGTQSISRNPRRLLQTGKSSNCGEASLVGLPVFIQLFEFTIHLRFFFDLNLNSDTRQLMRSTKIREYVDQFNKRSIQEIRRVKCDETKPHCLRCRSFKVQCDGYDLPASAKAKPQTLRPLVPQRKILIPAARPVLPVYKQPASNRFENESEARYFNCFHLEIARHLGGCFDPELWPGSFLRASESDWPIRKGLIALGALDLTSSAGLSQIREGIKPSNITDNYLFALQEYNRFIMGMKQAMNAEDLRTQLLASILIICFESYLGNAKSVETQVRTSVRLLQDWKDKNARPWFHPLTSPAPDIVEDELVHFFDRLDLEVMSQGDPLSQEEHWLLKDKGTELVVTMPKKFGSLREARMGVGIFPAPDIVEDELVHFFDRLDLEVMSQGDPLSQEEHWLLKDKGTELVVTMPKKFGSLREARMWGNLLHRRTVALLAAEDSNFTLSAHSIVVLDLVAKKCRNSAMRREAISLLADRPRREAFWDSVMAAKICAWIVKVEEEGMVDGFVPEEARVRKIGAKFDLEKKEAELWCYQPKEKGNIVDLRRRETTISWGTPSGSMAFYTGSGEGETDSSFAPVQWSRANEFGRDGSMTLRATGTADKYGVVDREESDQSSLNADPASHWNSGHVSAVNWEGSSKGSFYVDAGSYWNSGHCGVLPTGMPDCLVSILMLSSFIAQASYSILYTLILPAMPPKKATAAANRVGKAPVRTSKRIAALPTISYAPVKQPTSISTPKPTKRAPAKKVPTNKPLTPEAKRKAAAAAFAKVPVANITRRGREKMTDEEAAKDRKKQKDKKRAERKAAEDKKRWIMRR